MDSVTCLGQGWYFLGLVITCAVNLFLVTCHSSVLPWLVSSFINNWEWIACHSIPLFIIDTCNSAIRIIVITCWHFWKIILYLTDWRAWSHALIRWHTIIWRTALRFWWLYSMHLSTKYAVFFCILFSFPRPFMVGSKPDGQQTSSNANDMVSQTCERKKTQIGSFSDPRDASPVMFLLSSHHFTFYCRAAEIAWWFSEPKKCIPVILSYTELLATVITQFCFKFSVTIGS